MFKMLVNIKLKSQLLFLICLSISIIVLLQVIYLSWFELINKRNHSDFLMDTINQLEIKALSFSTDINNIANITAFNNITQQFINTEDIEDRLKLTNNMQVMIESIMLSNKSIDDIIVTDLDLVNIGAYRSEGFWVLNQVKKLLKDEKIKFDKPTHFMIEGHESGKTFYVCITKSFTSQETNSEFITVVIYNTDSLVNLVSSIQPNNNSLFMIIDANENVVAVNRKDVADSEKDWIKDVTLKSNESGFLENSKRSEQSLIYQKHVRNLHWKIIGMMPDVEISKDLSVLKQFGITTGGIVIMVLLGFGVVINRSITAPITRMSRFMSSIGQNYSTRRLDITNENEISLLAKVLNKMLDNIDAMNQKVVTSQEKLYKAELAKKHAQFSAFQSQVNPHFLYNTLDCIRSIALARDVPEIFEITTAMAKIFRYSIKENNYVKVGDELGCIKDYFKIIQIRQSNRFSIEYSVDKDIAECMIPKMILQPIVENAVFHGLEQKKGAGTLKIRGLTAESRFLHFEIEDNGKGMSQDVLRELCVNLAAWDPNEDMPVVLEKKSIGLINIDRRIKLLYGTNYGLSVESSQQAGTKVVVRLPMEHNNRN